MKRIITLLIILCLIGLNGCGSKGGGNNNTLSNGNTNNNNVNNDGGKEESAFIATAKIDVLSESNLEYKVKEAFPVELEAEITYTIQPNQNYSAEGSQTEDKVYNPMITYSDIKEDLSGAVDSFAFNLSYFLPYTAFPSDVAAQLKRVSYRSASPVRLMAGAGSGQSGVNVVAGGVMKSAGKKAVENMIKQGFGETPGKVIGKTGGGALDVMSAWDAHNEHSNWMERLDKIEDCVKNPSNPIDQKAHQEDGTLQQKQLDKIDATRTEIKLNTGVKFINKIVSTASGLTPAKVVWPIIAGGKAYTDDAMKQVNNAIVDALEKEMPTCKNYYTGWLNGKSTLKMGDDESIHVMDLKDITWKMTEHTPGNSTVYKMSRPGTVEVIKRGTTWEDDCNPVDQYFNGIQFEGTLVVYDVNRTDLYGKKYSWAIAPTMSSILQNVTAMCWNDDHTAKVPTQRQIAIQSHFSSCGYSSPIYNPFGKPDDMPQYSNVAILESSRDSWSCEYLQESASWSFLWSQLPE